MKKLLGSTNSILVILITFMSTLFFYNNPLNATNIDNTVEINPTFENVSTLEDHEIIVSTFDELKQTLTSTTDGKTTIYLGADIIATGGILIAYNKTNIIIDGTNPITGVRHTYTDFKSANYTNSIYIRSANSTYELRNIDINGENYYGSIVVENGYNNVTIKYTNIYYDGPQLGVNVGGTAIVEDSIIKIGARTYFSPSEEVFETLHLVFKGENTVLHTPSAIRSFHASGANGSFTIEDNADVYIVTSQSMNAASGNWTNFNFTVKENANLKIDQRKNSNFIIGGNAGIFSIGKGSNVELYRNFTGASSFNMLYWSNANGKFNMDGGTLTFIDNANTSSAQLDLGATVSTIEDSNINFQCVGIPTNYSWSSSGALTMNNSKLDITFEQATTKSTVGLNSTGLNSLDNSSITITPKSGIYGTLANLGDFNLINNSSFYIKVANTIHLTTASTPIVITKQLSLDSSSFIIDVTNPIGSTTLLQSGITTVNNNSTLKLTTMMTRFYNWSNSGGITIDNGSTLNVVVGAANTATAYPIVTNGDLYFGKDTKTNIAITGGTQSLTGLVTLSAARKVSVINVDYLVLHTQNLVSTKLFYSAFVVSFDINVQQINQYNAVQPLNSGGFGFKTKPQTTFIKNDNSSYKITGTMATGTSTSVTITSTNYVAQDGANPRSFLSFSASTTKIMSLGKLSIIEDEVVSNSTSITGKTMPLADVKVDYRSGGVLKSALAKADVNGNFKIETEKIDLSTYVLTANWNFLYIDHSDMPISKGKVEFIDKNVKLDFGKIAIPSKVSNFNVSDKDWKIGILDDRNPTSNWKLYAKVKNEMSPADSSKPTLDGSLVFIDNTNKVNKLSAEPVLIAESINGKTTTYINWEEDKGIMLNVNPSIVYSTTSYSGSVEFILEEV